MCFDPFWDRYTLARARVTSIVLAEPLSFIFWTAQLYHVLSVQAIKCQLVDLWRPIMKHALQDRFYNINTMHRDATVKKQTSLTPIPSTKGVLCHCFLNAGNPSFLILFIQKCSALNVEIVKFDFRVGHTAHIEKNACIQNIQHCRQTMNLAFIFTSGAKLYERLNSKILHFMQK